MATNINATIEELRTAINNATAKMSECCGRMNTGNEEGGVYDPPTIGVGSDYPDFDAANDAKCNSANWIYDGIKGNIAWLLSNQVDVQGGVFGGLTSAVIVGLAVSGPPGWVIGLIEATVAAIVDAVIVTNVSFDDLNDALDDVHEELVTALYNSSDPPSAEDAFITVLDGSVYSTTTFEQWLIKIMLSNNVLNHLFQVSPDSDNYQSPDPIDCAVSTLVTWTYDADDDDFTWSDTSNSGAQSEMAWNSDDESLEVQLQSPGSYPYQYARGVAYSDTISVAVDVGNSVQVDLSAPVGDTYGVAVDLIAFYSGGNIREIVALTDSGATVVLTIPGALTITQVGVQLAASSGGGGLNRDITMQIYEVRIQ